MLRHSTPVRDLVCRRIKAAARLLIFLAVLSVVLCRAADNPPLKIVVAGDARAEYPWRAQRSCDHDGMNDVVTRAISEAVLKEEASIFLWTGDIVNVNDKNPDTLKKGLEKWRGIMAPLYSAGKKVWPVRGNHEIYRYPFQNNYDGEPIPNASGIWRKVFSGPYALPPHSTSGEEDLSFYFVKAPVLIIGLDQYGGGDGNSDPLKRKHLVNQKWLDRVLEQHKQPLTFVFGHEAAFMAGHHSDDDTLSADATARNSFWQSLVNARAVYFCGHDHFYDRMSVVRNSSPAGRDTFQVTAGTAGAPFYNAGEYAGSALWKLQRVQKFEKGYGYVLIEVENNRATITFKGVKAETCSETDQFAFKPIDQMVCDASGCKTVPVNP